MPPRDEQDFESRRQQIIDAALHVFASKGFEKATNKDIAEAAKIKSPGLIYHYFQDKADLFRQVMRERAPVLQLLDRGDELMELPPRQALTLLGTAFLKTMENRHAIAMLKLMIGEAIRRPAVAEMIAKVGPARGLAFLTKYLEHQMDKGVLRRVDARAAAISFMGPLASYVFTREVFDIAQSRTLEADIMVQTNVDIFLNGLEAHTS